MKAYVRQACTANGLAFYYLGNLVQREVQFGVL